MRCICQIQFVSGEFYVARSFKVTHNILVRILGTRLMTGAIEMLRKQLNLPEIYWENILCNLKSNFVSQNLVYNEILNAKRNLQNKLMKYI